LALIKPLLSESWNGLADVVNKLFVGKHGVKAENYSANGPL
jgi:hypothetical protein